jgi:predicted nuclease of restriction endonuclease-like RecB superfamily
MFDQDNIEEEDGDWYHEYLDENCEVDYQKKEEYIKTLVRDYFKKFNENKQITKISREPTIFPLKMPLFFNYFIIKINKIWKSIYDMITSKTIKVFWTRFSVYKN